MSLNSHQEMLNRIWQLRERRRAVTSYRLADEENTKTPFSRRILAHVENGTSILIQRIVLTEQREAPVCLALDSKGLRYIMLPLGDVL